MADWPVRECSYCDGGRENLCDRARFTGYDTDGGYAELCVADERFCFPIPGSRPPGRSRCSAPRLIGYRSLRLVGDATRVGLYRFRAAARIVCQVAVHAGQEVYALTRPERTRPGQAFARSLGATWAGDTAEGPPVELDAAILYAPAGRLVPTALRHLGKGGSVVCAEST